MQHEAADKSINFFKTTRYYRNAGESPLKEDKTSRHTVNAVILQELTQDQSANKENKSQNDKNDRTEDYKDDECICEATHAFKDCSYIISSKRETD
jgi:hypothetical protein